MPKIRNANGQYMTATSNNSLDAHIPSNGMHSRIMAKNLHQGDTLAMRGAPNRPVAAIVEGPQSTIYVGFMNESGTGQVPWLHPSSTCFDHRNSLQSQDSS